MKGRAVEECKDVCVCVGGGKRRSRYEDSSESTATTLSRSRLARSTRKLRSEEN